MYVTSKHATRTHNFGVQAWRSANQITFLQLKDDKTESLEKIESLGQQITAEKNNTTNVRAHMESTITEYVILLNSRWSAGANKRQTEKKTVLCPSNDPLFYSAAKSCQPATFWPTSRIFYPSNTLRNIS